MMTQPPKRSLRGLRSPRTFPYECFEYPYITQRPSPLLPPGEGAIARPCWAKHAAGTATGCITGWWVDCVLVRLLPFTNESKPTISD